MHVFLQVKTNAHEEIVGFGDLEFDAELNYKVEHFAFTCT